jgi:hypothetical protein
VRRCVHRSCYSVKGKEGEACRQAWTTCVSGARVLSSARAAFAFRTQTSVEIGSLFDVLCSLRYLASGVVMYMLR